MATYYVKLAADGGNDSLAGTSPSTAWATIGKALGATGIASGDTLYIAPGTYNESVTINITNPTAETFIIGDPTASQFPGIAAGPVYHSAWNAAGTTQITSGVLITGTTKNYLHFQNIWWASDAANMVVLNTSRYAKFTRCQFVSSNRLYNAIRLTSATSTPVDATITRCAFVGGNTAIFLQGTNTTDATNITDSLFVTNSLNIDSNSTNFSCFNCTFFESVNGVVQRANTTGTASFVRNSLFLSYSSFAIQATSAGVLTENFNRLIGSGRSNVTTGANSVSTGAQGVDYTYLLNQGMNYQQIWTSLQGGPNIAFGTATGAPAADLYGVTWTGASPDAGSGAYRIINSTPSQIAYNGGNERNASAITIAPGSTSQSIELYLGATGLAFNTSGLQAYYIRNRSAPVAITLVTQTATGAWTSGGFAQISSSLTPGVYRLDVPDAALAAGADDVTIVVRGASGTNGAVMTVKLSSGGLTSAQTASAVWGASPAGYGDATTFGGVVNQIDATVTGTSTLVQDVPSNVWEENPANHTTHATFGYNILRADAPSKEGLVTLHQSGGISRVDADIHAIVNDTAAAAELKGALLHTGGDYISADLLTPVTSAQTVRIGPFAVRTDAGGADGALDLNQSTAGAVVVQLTDAQGTGIDQTSATVQAKVYNVAGGLVATYTCTPAYAVNGFVSIPMTTAVTGTAGSYIINLWSTVGATVIIYGPLQLRVRAI